MAMTEMATISTQPTRRINPVILGLIMIVPLLVVLVLGLALIEANRAQITDGPAPDFQLKTHNGAEFKLSQQRGNVVIINFWASWCPPCRSEAADLNALWDEYRGRGVIMIGVVHRDDEDDAAAFITEFGIEYDNAQDLRDEISQLYGVAQVPETYIIDQQGNIAWHVPGPTSAADLRPVLNRLLAQ
jgi:cytochrome c biogenesis protein CcmG, thiol:disulfide interchange protein DsbE